MEKRWSPTTKRLVVVGGVIAVFLLASRVSRVLSPIIISLVLAYILSPIASFLSTRLRMSRTLAVVFIYLILIAIILTAPALLIPSLITQIEEFVETAPQLVQEIGEFIQQPLIFGDFQLDVRDIYEQISSSLQGILSSAASQTINILSNIASMLLWTVFILVSSFYLVKDQALIVKYLEGVFPPSYHPDVRKLRTRIAVTWNAFLRGQIILCLTMGAVVGITMALIGLPNAWLMGRAPRLPPRTSNVLSAGSRPRTPYCADRSAVCAPASRNAARTGYPLFQTLCRFGAGKVSRTCSKDTAIRSTNQLRRRTARPGSRSGR